jgi:HK97 family phage prohead protease
MNKIDKEQRCYTCQFRAIEPDNEASRLVEGYAAVYNSDSEYMGFVERIEPGAFDGVIERSDVLALLNHDERRGVLARSKNGEGSLHLEVTDEGLLYRFEAPKTALGDELMENLRRGEIDASSFAFTIKKEEWVNVGDANNEQWLRKIIEVDQLYDVSPVYHPAYSATTCSMRSEEGLKQAKADALRARQFAELDKLDNKI